MLKIALTLSILAAALAVELTDTNLTNVDLTNEVLTNTDLTDVDLPFLEADADLNQATPYDADAINFNSLISSESAKNILLASNEISFQSESAQAQWLEAKQKDAINGDPHCVVICDTVTTRTGGQRKALLLGHGYQPSSVITIYNSEEKSCYILHSRDEELVRLTTLTDSYTTAPLSYVWKMRQNTVDAIFKTDRNGPLKLNSLVFQQNKVELFSATSEESPSYADKVVKFTKDEVLSEKLFFAANNQPGSKSMEFFGHENDGNDSLPPKIDEITTICKESYDYIKFSYNDFMGDKDLMKMTMDTEDMEKFIVETYIPSMSITTDEIFKNCVLSIVTSMSLLPEVASIEALAQGMVANDQLQYMVQTFTEKKYPFYDAGLTGKNEVVAISDTGIDVNNCYFWDTEKSVPYGQYSIDLSNRKIVQYDNYADMDDEYFGHGTHTAGTIAGRRAINGVEESKGIADGVAYDAKLAFLDMGNSAGVLLLPDASRIVGTGRPYAKIHSASWVVKFALYNEDTSEIDHYMRVNDDFLFVSAAGNDGTNNQFNSIFTPCDSKNGICVGASNSYGPDATMAMAGPNYVAAFSSKGSTADGRIKPDIVAPGHYVLSAGAQPSVTGECDPADGIYPRADDMIIDGVGSMHGTSMATPAVAGTLAMIRQYFKDGFYPSGEKCEDDSMEPSGALLKAVLLNGGQQLDGIDNAGYVYSDFSQPQWIFPSVAYDVIQGFGRVSLQDSLYIKDASNVKAVVHDRQGIKEGETKCISVSIDHSGWCKSRTFSVTLVWMDKASMPGCVGKCLINDLDLHVTKNHDDHNKFYPNGLTGLDDHNTVERVRIEGVEHDDVFSIYVRGANFDDFDETQHYALAVTGCVNEKHDDYHSESKSSSMKGKKGRSERQLEQKAKGGRGRRRSR